MEQLRAFSEACGLPMAVLCAGELEQDYGACAFSPSPVVAIQQAVPPGINIPCYTVSPEYLVCGLVPIAGDRCVLVGPASPFALTRKQAQGVLRRLGQPMSRAPELLFWLQKYPLCTFQRFTAALRLVSGLFGMVSARPKQLLYPENDLSIPPTASTPVPLTDGLEHRMLACVKHGQIKELENLLSQMETQSDLEIPILADDMQRAFKNTFINATALCSRAAVSGGLDYGTAGNLAATYMQQIEQLESYTSIQRLTYQMFFDFTRRAADAHIPPSNSPLVPRVCRFVQSRLYETVSARDVADHLGLDRSHVSRHFRQKTGMTLTQYITSSKVREARYLLQSSALPLADVATRLGFSSQHYFHTVFKAETGMTPTQYRTKQAVE